MTITLPEPIWHDNEHGAYAMVRHFKLVAYPPSKQFPLAQGEVWILGHRLRRVEVDGGIEDAKGVAILAWHYECGADVALPDNRHE